MAFWEGRLEVSLFLIIAHIHITGIHTSTHTDIHTHRIDRIKKSENPPLEWIFAFLFDALLFFHSVDLFFQIIMSRTFPRLYTGNVRGTAHDMPSHRSGDEDEEYAQ